MSKNSKYRTLFKNYFLYLSIFTLEIIIVVGYFTWKNKKLLVDSTIVKKFGLAEKYSEEYEVFLDAYKATVSHYYLMAGIVILSVILMAALIHILMKRRIKDIERLNYLETITKNSKEILRNEIKYRSLFENNGTAILVVGKNDIITDCNRKFVELAGCSKKEDLVNNVHWEKIVHEDDVKRVYKYDHLRKNDPEKAPKEYVMKLKRMDGGIRHVMVTVIMMDGTDELASMVDITDMVQKDNELKEQEEILSQAQEIASMGSWTYLAESGELKVSKEFLVMLNIEEKEEKNLTLDYFRDKLGFEQFYDTLNKMNSRNSSVDKEITYLDEHSSRSDKTVFFKIKAKSVSLTGEPLKIIGIIQDVTDKKRIENEINRTNRDMKNLMYVTTHDLQIPLISIEGFANLLIRSCEQEKMSSESVEYLNRIISNTKSMTSLFKNFFDLSKINSVQNPFEMINVANLIEEVISDKKYLTDKYGAKVRINEPSSVKNIYGDKENIKLLYHHLIANAVIYGGKNIVAGYDENKGYYVKDDGRGIAEKDLDKIFLPGERLNEEDILSSGMGLAFCRKTIEIHNGRIYAESEGKNKGTTIYFTLSNELIRN